MVDFKKSKQNSKPHEPIILECNLRKVGKMTWSNFIFVSEKNESCCGFMNLNGIFFFWLNFNLTSSMPKGKWLPNGKNKKEKNGKENRDEWKKEQFYG